MSSNPGSPPASADERPWQFGHRPRRGCRLQKWSERHFQNPVLTHFQSRIPVEPPPRQRGHRIPEEPPPRQKGQMPFATCQIVTSIFLRTVLLPETTFESAQ